MGSITEGIAVESHHQEFDAGIREEAARWLIDLEEEPRDFDRAAFAAWLKASRRHVEEFLLATAAWKEFDNLPTDGRIEVNKICAEVQSNVVHLQETLRDSQLRPAARKVTWTKYMAGFATVVTVLMAAWFWGPYSPNYSQSLVTRIGEQRVFKLADGSLVHLNTASRVKISFTESSRDVRLLQGEVLFTVMHDPRRPFRVIADDAVIQAIGTQFVVYRRPTGTTVSVLEGRVKVVAERTNSGSTSSRESELISHADHRESAGESRPGAITRGRAVIAMVTAGEQARVGQEGLIEQQAVKNVAEATAWRQRRLVFRGDTLRDIAAEFNRYNERRIRVEGVDVGERRLTGVFDADDPESLVQFLAKDDGLSIESNAGEIVIRSK